MNLRPLRALKELDKRLDKLDAEDRAAEELARFELARSASRYTRRTQKVVDETMSLSATMMRAGEVKEAERLMQEVEREVRTEEAALIESVNEVKAAEAVRHRHLTKLRFLRGLATAFLSGGMFAISAFGMVAARHLTSDDPTVQPPDVAGVQVEAGTTETRTSSLKAIRVAPGVKLTLTPFELKTFTRLTKEMDEQGLRKFLEDRLPLSMVAEVQSVLLTAATEAFDEKLEEPMQFIIAAVRQQASETSEEVAEEPADRPSPSENPSDESSAEPEQTSPSPEPEPSPSDDKGEEEDSSVPLGWPLDDEDDNGEG